VKNTKIICEYEYTTGSDEGLSLGLLSFILFTLQGAGSDPTQDVESAGRGRKEEDARNERTDNRWQ